MGEETPTPRIEGRFEIDRPPFRLRAAIDLPMRGVSGLFGPSGAGKTTLLRCLAGLERAPQGYLRVGERLWQDEARGFFLPPHRRRVGVVFQEARLFPHLTVEKNLRYGLRRKPEKTAGLAFEPVVELLGLQPLLGRSPSHLSGGEQKRVAIGRALLAAPRLLLMDEPLAGLDLARRLEILPFLERLHRQLEIPVVLVSHDLAEVTRLADHLVLIGQGEVTAQGPPPQLLSRLDLPLAWREDAVSTWEGRVAGHDPHYGLTLLATPAGPLTLLGLHGQPGETVRLFIQARDVSLTLGPPGKSSILNILPMRVEAVQSGGKEMDQEGLAQEGLVQEGLVMVRLEAGGCQLLSRITQKSRDLLALRPGTPVYGQIKSVAVEMAG